MMLIDEALQRYQGDAFFYLGEISRTGYDLVSSTLEGKADKKDKACVILTTYGGDPNAGYRIARALHHHYRTVEILIADVCKSAGTLICIGANKLIFGDRGELGPLDIQLSKPDEMFESMSGLDIVQALNVVEERVLTSFRKNLVDIRNGSRVTTKMAAEIATKLTEGFISPIAAKIDPVTLGEHQRAMNIAYEYGDRLNTMSSSLKSNSALVDLVTAYPSHSFVIDRKEATTLFNNVVAPEDETIKLYEWARDAIGRVGQVSKPLFVDVATIVDNGGTDESGNDDQGQRHDEEQAVGDDTGSNTGPNQEGEVDEPVDKVDEPAEEFIDPVKEFIDPVEEVDEREKLTV